MFLLPDFFFFKIHSFLCLFFFSSMLILHLLLFPVIVWSLGDFFFFFSSVNLTVCLYSLSSLPALRVEIYVLSTQSFVGGQEHGKGQAGGTLDLKASPGLSRWKDLADSPRNLVPSLSKSVWRAPCGTPATRKASSSPL